MSTEYRICSKKAEELEKILNRLNTIYTNQTIPKENTPKLIKSNDPILDQQFLQEYTKLFFNHIRRTISNCNIKLEVIKARLNSIVTREEDRLSNLQIPPHEILSQYQQFCTSCNIQNRKPTPKLQALIETSQSHPNSAPETNYALPSFTVSQPPTPSTTEPSSSQSPTSTNPSQPSDTQRRKQKRKHQALNPPAAKRNHHHSSDFLSQGHHPRNHPP